MSRSLEVEVGPTCISSGYCRNFAPAVFEAGADRKSFVKTNPVTETPALLEAFESCPVEAITARDADSGAEVFP
ncbi:MAG: 4Fe-4S single cluster domain of Ferredoxin [Frankiales bacterium]|nr:4Fe-4S single cluster domain of Ferredoxin [Frankiales bacterium]